MEGIVRLIISRRITQLIVIGALPVESLYSIGCVIAAANQWERADVYKSL